MLIVSIEAIMVEIHRHDVPKRQPIHHRLRIARTMKDEREQRQRLAQTQRSARLNQNQFRLCRFPFRFFRLPNLNLTNEGWPWSALPDNAERRSLNQFEDP